MQEALLMDGFTKIFEKTFVSYFCRPSLFCNVILNFQGLKNFLSSNYFNFKCYAFYRSSWIESNIKLSILRLFKKLKY